MTPQEVAARLRLSLYRLGGPSGEYRITAHDLKEFMWQPSGAVDDGPDDDLDTEGVVR